MRSTQPTPNTSAPRVNEHKVRRPQKVVTWSGMINITWATANIIHSTPPRKDKNLSILPPYIQGSINRHYIKNPGIHPGSRSTTLPFSYFHSSGRKHLPLPERLYTYRKYKREWVPTTAKKRSKLPLQKIPCPILSRLPKPQTRFGLFLPPSYIKQVIAMG